MKEDMSTRIMLVLILLAVIVKAGHSFTKVHEIGYASLCSLG